MDTSAWSSQAERNESEDKFMYYADVVSLEEMASYKISTIIWTNCITQHEPSVLEEILTNARGVLCRTFKCGDYLSGRRDNWAWTEELGLPQFFEKRILKCIDKVVEQTNDWIRHFRFDIMRTKRLTRYQIQHFDSEWCVWSPEGEIDYEKTAVKMVASPGPSNTNECGLTKEQKFAIMSNYCMEDEIKAFPPPPKKFVQAVRFEKNPLIFYWNCYRRKVLHNVPLGNHHSIDLVMALKCYNQTWTAFEYFWHRLSDEDQIVAAAKRLRNAAVDQGRLLSKMSWYQQFLLLREMPLKIVLNFLQPVCLPEPALWAWKHTQDLWTAEQFAGIVMKVFLFKANEIEMCLLVEMWDTAPDTFRKYFAENKDDEMAEHISCKKYASGKKFIFRFLSAKTVDSRKDFISKNAVKFAERIGDLKFMKDLIEMCLPNSEDQLELKKSIMESKEMKSYGLRSLLLWPQYQLEDFCSKIEFYSFDKDSEIEFKQRLLNLQWESISSVILPDLFCSSYEWMMLSNFIDEAFPNDESSATSVKKKLILLYVNKLSDDWSWSSSVNGAMKVIESTLRGDELQNAKRLCANCFENLWTRNFFFWISNVKKLHEFVSWCFSDDEKAILEFKSTAPADKVFDDIIDELHCIYVNDCDFAERLLSDLNDFLMWVFSNVEKANEYKFNRIGSLEKLPVFKALNERNDEQNLEKLTKWYFNDDEAQIRKFRSKKLKTK